MNRALIALLLILSTSTAPAASPTANLVFQDGAAADDTRPRVVDSRLIQGYLTEAGPYDGSQLTVQRLNPDPAQGFLPDDPLQVFAALPLPAAQYSVGVNQIAPDRAVSYFGDAGVYDPLRVEIDPVPGIYQGTIRVQFFAPDATTQISYSLNGGALKTYQGERIYLASDTTIEFSGSDGVNPPVAKSASYTFLFPDCLDLDSDGIPDRVEMAIGLDPLVAQGDFNGNLVDDFDEYIRGASVFVANTPLYVAPDMTDTDGDNWSDYDETLRATDPNDPLSKPVSPNLRTVEFRRSGAVADTAAGGSPPPATPPDKPFPASWRVETVFPDGTVVDPGHESADGTWTLRASGHQFEVHRARANDGTGRVALGLSAPAALCIDTGFFCGDAVSPADWRDEWRAAYEVSVFRVATDRFLDPRTMAEAMLLNRYYETAAGAGAEFAIGESGRGPGQDLVLDLRSRRNDAALHQRIAAAVTPAMIDLVTDYLRYHTSPRPRGFVELLADHFAGRAVDPAYIPANVRVDNIAAVAAQTAVFIAAIPPEATLLTGIVDVDEFGFLLDVDGTDYRLLKLAEAFVPGTTVSLRALVDIDNCGGDPLPAQVVGVVSRGLGAIPPGKDVDADTLDDDWEFFFKGSLLGDAGTNSDGDEYTDGEEYLNGTNPLVPDAPPAPVADLWTVY